MCHKLLEQGSSYVGESDGREKAEAQPLGLPGEEDRFSEEMVLWATKTTSLARVPSAHRLLGWRHWRAWPVSSTGEKNFAAKSPQPRQEEACGVRLG